MEWLDVIKSVVFGIIEGVTEWLPISSTGHLILLERLIPLTSGDSPEQRAAFFSFFIVVIQFGAIMAVVVSFWRELWPFPRRRQAAPDPTGNALIPYQIGRSSWVIDRRILKLWGQILVACIPAAIIGLLFDDKIESLFYNPWTVAIMLVVVGIAFLVIERHLAKKGEPPRVTSMGQMGWKEVVGVGLFQVIAAVFPGTSRSGATILGGLMMGMSRSAAAEFTFYLAVPVMAGASLLKFVTRSGSFTGIQWICVAVGMAVAYLVSILIISFLMRYIRRNDFRIFAYYRILLGVVVLFAAIAKFI